MTYFYSPLLIEPNSDTSLKRSTLSYSIYESDAGSDVITTPTFTPPDNSLLVIAVSFELVNDLEASIVDRISITDTEGLTWTKQISNENPVTTYDWTHAIYTAPVTTSAAMSVTATIDLVTGTSRTASRSMMQLVWYTNYNTSSPIGATAANTEGWVVGAARNITLSANPDANSEVFASAIAFNSTASITGNTNWTQIAYGGPNAGSVLHTQARKNSTSNTITWDNVDADYGYSGLAIEITQSIPIVDSIGTLSITEDGDTITSTANSEVAAIASITTDSDTVTSISIIDIAATSSITETGDTVSSTSTVAITSTSSLTEDSDTVTSDSVVSIVDIIATASITETGDTVTSSVITPINSTTSFTEDDDTAILVAAINVVSSITSTEDDDSVVSSGTVYSDRIGDASITESDDTLVATSISDVFSLFSVTEDDDTLTSISLVVDLLKHRTNSSIITIHSPIIANTVVEDVGNSSIIIRTYTANVVTANNISNSSITISTTNPPTITIKRNHG